MARTIVFDASAMMAALAGEPGATVVLKAMNGDVPILVSSVNLCEVGTKLARDGGSSDQVAIGLRPFLKYLVAFDLEQAIYAAELARSTTGLSLGDRACLALAASRGAEAWTADRAWERADVGVRIVVIRPG